MDSSDSHHVRYYSIYINRITLRTQTSKHKIYMMNSYDTKIETLTLIRLIPDGTVNLSSSQHWETVSGYWMITPPHLPSAIGMGVRYHLGALGKRITIQKKIRISEELWLIQTTI